MKSSFILFVVAVASVGSFLSANNETPRNLQQAGNPYQVVSLQDLTTESLNNFFLGKLPNLAIECPVGMSLPLSLFVTGDFLTIDSEAPEQAATVKVAKSFYLRNVDQNVLFSLDLTDWKDFTQFATGVFNVSISVQDYQPTVNVSLEINERE